MRNGICPKCAAHAVYQQAGNLSAHEGIALTGGVINKGTAPDKYVCVECGYMEYYLTKPEDLATIRAHWSKVAAE